MANNSGQRGGGNGNGGFGATVSGNDLRKVIFLINKISQIFLRHKFMAAHRVSRQDLKSCLKLGIDQCFDLFPVIYGSFIMGSK
jgi:hypothetical protein